MIAYRCFDPVLFLALYFLKLDFSNFYRTETGCVSLKNKHFDEGLFNKKTEFIIFLEFWSSNYTQMLQVRLNLQVNSFPSQVNLFQPRSICFNSGQFVSA